MRAPRRLAAFQGQAESLMTLRFDMFEPTGQLVTDGNGREVEELAARGSTVGKIQAGSRQGGDTAVRYVRVGAVELPVMFAGLHIPVSCSAPDERWEFVVTAVGSGADPTLMSRRFRVVGVPAKSFATARRLDVVQIPSP